MTNFKNMSLADLEKLEQHMPHLAGFPSRVLAAERGYESWIDRLYKDIDHIVKEVIYPTASYRQDDGEDRYNTEIANNLKIMGYQAAHDKWTNGHPDIFVENAGYGYKWTGESKIHSGYDYLLEGYKQLCERYSSGFDNEQCGAVLIITDNIDINALMTKWRQHLSEDVEYQEKGVRVWNCPVDTNCFYSSHSHSTSGGEYTVRHIPITIRFKPTDKSARNRKSG